MLHISRDYLDDLMVRMAHHSTAIEGNSLTQGETKSILIDNYLPRAMDYKIQNYKNEGFQKTDIKINTAEADLIEIIIVRLGGENQDQKGLVDFLYGLFSGNQEKVLSYIPDSDKPVRQKEVADMLSMISYAEENGEKKGEKKGENRLGTLMNILLKNKRYSDAEKASEDEEYREELYKEYKL